METCLRYYTTLRVSPPPSVSSPGSGDRWTFDNVPDVIAEDYGSDDDDDDVMDHDENIYDDPEGDEDDPYSYVDSSVCVHACVCVCV